MSVRWFVAPIAAGVVLGALGVWIAPSGGTSPWLTTFPWFVAAGVVVTLVLWGTNRSRKLTVSPDQLRMARRAIPFAAIETVRLVDRSEAKRIVETMRYSPLRPSTYGHRKRQYGAWWQPWMDGGILVHLKPGSRAITDDWLIGTRHPQQLLELIQAGLSRSPSGAGAPPDVASSVA